MFLFCDCGIHSSGFIQVTENLENSWNLRTSFPGLQSHGIYNNSGLSVDWKDTILPLVKKISGQVLCYILYSRKCSKLD